LVRLYNDIFDWQENKLEQTEITRMFQLESLAGIMAIIGMIGMCFPMTWWVRLTILGMIATFGFAAVLGSRIARRRERKLNELEHGWHDVRENKTVMEAVDQKRWEYLLKEASKFARDNDTIVYYYTGKSSRIHGTHEDRDKQFIKFGFLRDDLRILFRLKYL
jgi:ABC-type multidrug transport system fused ATPase/permease subunit